MGMMLSDGTGAIWKWWSTTRLDRHRRISVRGGSDVMSRRESAAHFPPPTGVETKGRRRGHAHQTARKSMILASVRRRRFRLQLKACVNGAADSQTLKKALLKPLPQWQGLAPCRCDTNGTDCGGVDWARTGRISPGGPQTESTGASGWNQQTFKSSISEHPMDDSNVGRSRCFQPASSQTGTAVYRAPGDRAEVQAWPRDSTRVTKRAARGADRSGKNARCFSLRPSIVVRLGVARS